METRDGTVSSATDATACWLDQTPCVVTQPVVAWLTKHAPDAASAILAAHHDLRPCATCRRPIFDAQALPGTRLGQQERALLLRAADEGTAVIAPEGTPRSAQEAALRAARRLEALGLVKRGTIRDLRTSPWETVYGWVNMGRGKRQRIDVRYERQRQVFPRVRTATLTPFGAAIVAAFREELETGAAIRWDTRVQRATVTSTESQAALRERFRARVAQRVERASERVGRMLPMLREIDGFPGVKEALLRAMEDQEQGAALLAAYAALDTPADDE